MQYSTIITDVFFDLDHTLWDFEKNSALTFEKILNKHQIDVYIDDFLRTYVPINQAYWKLYREGKVSKEALRYERLKKSFDAIGFPISDQLINRLAIDYIEELASFNYLFPNTLEILDYLKPKYRLHIITNGFQEVQKRKMKNSGILNYFDQIIDSEMAGVKKPDPYIFQLALDSAGVTSKEAMMIGDNIEADILGAQALGFHTLHFNGHNGPKHEYCHMIHGLDEIKMYL
ncbi:YjjG family noncanonical pyrimidine nucleotidase [Spongiimicrobium salis]|uniref:YjjG family noncanonical pyrimidine nucleotidase n=1 Tax=Spongiimicrobium salis TaxID=1667022 RepID=UPI00374CBF58